MTHIALQEKLDDVVRAVREAEKLVKKGAI
jgi:hypothetical protein